SLPACQCIPLAEGGNAWFSPPPSAPHLPGGVAESAYPGRADAVAPGQAESEMRRDVDWQPSVAPPDLSSEVAVAKHTQRVRYLSLARRLPWRLRKAAGIGGIHGGAIDLLR